MQSFAFTGARPASDVTAELPTLGLNYREEWIETTPATSTQALAPPPTSIAARPQPMTAIGNLGDALRRFDLNRDGKIDGREGATMYRTIEKEHKAELSGLHVARAHDAAAAQWARTRTLRQEVEDLERRNMDAEQTAQRGALATSLAKLKGQLSNKHAIERREVREWNEDRMGDLEDRQEKERDVLEWRIAKLPRPEVKWSKRYLDLRCAEDRLMEQHRYVKREEGRYYTSTVSRYCSLTFLALLSQVQGSQGRARDAREDPAGRGGPVLRGVGSQVPRRGPRGSRQEAHVRGYQARAAQRGAFLLLGAVATAPASLTSPPPPLPLLRAQATSWREKRAREKESAVNEGRVGIHLRDMKHEQHMDNLKRPELHHPPSKLLERRPNHRKTAAAFRGEQLSGYLTEGTRKTSFEDDSVDYSKLVAFDPRGRWAASTVRVAGAGDRQGKLSGCGENIHDRGIAEVAKRRAATARKTSRGPVGISQSQRVIVQALTSIHPFEANLESTFAFGEQDTLWARDDRETAYVLRGNTRRVEGV